jgi:type III secretion protein L
MAFIVSRHALTPVRRLQVALVTGTRVVPAQDRAAWLSAQALVAQAQAQALAIEASAQAAYDAEKQRGFDEGLEAASLEQAEQMMENVSRTIDYFGQVEGRMIDLVMQAVQKIMADFDDQQRIVITVKNVLSVVRNQKQLTLRLNPHQVDAVKERVNELLAAYPGVGYIDILPDSRVKQGACILESDIGLVEASMEGQLAALRAAFAKVLGSRI